MAPLQRSSPLLGLVLSLSLALATGALGIQLQQTTDVPAAKACAPTNSCFVDGNGVNQCFPCKLATGVCDFNWFKPDDLSLDLGVVVVPPGTTCSWHWVQDAVGHCVQPGVANPPDWQGKAAGSPNEALAGYVYNHTFSNEGVYKYRCCSHLAAMIGTIVVSKAAGPAPSSPPPPKALKSPPPPKAASSPPPLKPLASPPPPKVVAKSPPPPKITASPPPPKMTASPPPSSCTPKCQGRCYGKNGCGGTCPYPADNSPAKCTTCCKVRRPMSTTKATITKCIAACKK